MAEPFSIAASVLGVLDVTARATSFLWKLYDEAGRLDDDLKALQTEVQSLESIVQTIREKYEEETNSLFLIPTASSPQIQSPSSPFAPSPSTNTLSPLSPGGSTITNSSPFYSGSIQKSRKNTLSPLSVGYTGRPDVLWPNVNNILNDSKELVDDFLKLLKYIAGGEDVGIKGKWDGLKKALRRQAKDDEFDKCRQKLNNNMSHLSLALTSITLTQVLRMSNSNDDAFVQLSSEVQKLGVQMKSQIAALQPKGNMPTANEIFQLLSFCALVEESVLNKHFPSDHAVSSEYTGREGSMQILEDVVLEEMDPQKNMQKRFVIWGLAGCGKTELAAKFCQDFRKSFWGIFWVDASNDEIAMQSFAKIAEIGGVFSKTQSTEMNFQSGKAWLTQCRLPWLLVIDSADDTDMNIRKYFPAGERGFILITTRNEAVSTLGTAGDGHMQLDVLDEPEAADLLLRSAMLVKPSPSTRTIASIVSSYLGFLPLAIVHAGAAIRSVYATLEGYKESVERAWKRVSSSRIQSKSYTDDEQTLRIYKSYELIYQSLETRNDERSSKAIELLKIFAYFHPANIRIDLLQKAVENFQLDKKARESDSIQKAKSRSCIDNLKDASSMAVLYIKQDRGPPVLPSFIKDGKFDETSFHDALATLISTSLITRASKDRRGSIPLPEGVPRTVSMHSLVHKWVRDRPAMAMIEQAIWSEAAANALGQTIVLPPLGYNQTEEAFRRALIPHIDSVRHYQKEIAERYESNQNENWKFRLLPYPKPKMSFMQAGRIARFSRVYMESGRWTEAKELQSQALQFFIEMLGVGHTISIRCMLALSFTNWGLGNTNDAAELQQAVMDARIASLGESAAEKDASYLQAMDLLGVSRWQQGRMREALKLHQGAFDGMKASKEIGPHAKATYIAKDHIGRVHSKYFRFAEAKDCHLEAVSGLRDLPDAREEDCYQEARDNLGVSYLELKSDFKRAHSILTEVVEARTVRLGPEHPFTLWSKCNLARAKCAMGSYDEAESMLRKGLKVAEHTLGRDHIGHMMGEARLAEVKFRTGRYQEADEELEDICRRLRNVPSATSGEHPDRIGALLLCVDSFKLQKRYDDAIQAFEELKICLTKLGGHDHPLQEMVRKELKYLEDLKERTTTRSDSYQACL